jgi:hypothetical protein
MEATMLIIAVIAGLAALGVASITWGVDSRERIADDHAR